MSFSTVYIKTVRLWLPFSFGKICSSPACLGRIEVKCMVHVVLHKRLINYCLMHVKLNHTFEINCHCDSIIDFFANSYFILQIYHAKRFEMKYNVWVEKTETSHSSVSLLWLVSVFLTQTLVSQFFIKT